MTAIAKVFSTGNSQAVRLPKAFRVDVPEMWITKNEVTGEILLKPKDDAGREARIAALLKMIEDEPFTEDWIPGRSNDPPRNPLADWEALPDGDDDNAAAGRTGDKKP